MPETSHSVSPTSHGKILGLAVATGLLLALLAPFRTAEIFTLWELAAFWILSSIFGCYLLYALHLVAQGLARARTISPRIWLPVSAIIAAIPTTLIVHALGPALNSDIRLSAFWQLFPSVAILCLPLQYIIHLILQNDAIRATAVQKLQAEQISNTLAGAQQILFEKLPLHLGSDILCMKTEDHYLRVYTQAGNALVLLRMSDAENAVCGVDGLRVHRSWWVARHAVAEVVSVGNGLQLRLTNGLDVPVSRERRLLLKSNGWM
ncbi:MAG: LytTR family DNA-binding domain-containing protein [Sphingorhabdus sp.]